MNLSRTYYTLVASLPHLPTHFDVERLPISRSELAGRLDLLVGHDRQVIEQVEQFFVWDRQPLERTDQEVIQTYQRLQRQIRNALVLCIMEHRLDMRTIVNALRRHRRGEGPPQGVGLLTDTIRRNWTRPYFTLASRYAWIEPFVQALEGGRPRTGQRLLFEDLWTTWTRAAQAYYFSFESVILYLARWEILDRWTSQNALEGKQRFQNLLSETMREYSQLY